MKGPLSAEVRQSLALIVFTGAAMALYLGLGLLVAHVLG